MGKYFSTTVKPILPVATMIASNKADNAFAHSDVLFDWTAFDIPKGANKLTSVTSIVKGLHGAPQTDRDIILLFAKSEADGTAPESLGNVNGSVNGTDYYHLLQGYHTIDVTQFALYLDWLSVATAGGGGDDGTRLAPNLILQGEPNSGTNVGYDKLYVGAIMGPSGDFNFSTGVLLNDGDNVAEGDTALVTDGVDANKAFSKGDVILKHDSDTVVGTVKSVTANLITLESGSGVAITDDDEIMPQSPITVILGFER
tara:strand:- start:13 stop:783 length:771 start_codon:yes stop_codon:yes gene_type:complete